MRNPAEVRSLSRGVMSPFGSTPIRSITGQLSPLPQPATRSPIGSPCGSLSLPGGLRPYRVPHLHPDGLGPACPPVATMSATEQHVLSPSGPLTFWSKPPPRGTAPLACSFLTAGLAIRMPWPYHQPSPRPPWCWQSQSFPHRPVCRLHRRRGYFVPKASHRGIAPAARFGRVVGAEPQVESL